MTELSSSKRRWLFRAAAVVLGLAPILLLELALRLGGWGAHSDVDDPYVGFFGTQPLFELNRATGRFETSKKRRLYFGEASFLAKKPAQGYRIFVLGGSTVQGHPWEVATAFSTWLELSLRAADPSRSWEVVNCGGISYAAYRLAPILVEALHYEPDLFIVYEGHNDFLEDRTYDRVKATPAFVAEAHEWASRFRTYVVARRAAASLFGQPKETPKPRLGVEVTARLDFQGGLAEYHRDDAWRAGVITHFETTLGRMASLAGGAGVPVLFVNPAVDLKDTAPFKSEPKADLPLERVADVKRLWVAASDPKLPPADREHLLSEALAIDDRFAVLHFDRGHALEDMGRFDEAKREYVRAKEEDICPLRILEPMRDALRRVATKTGSPLVDVEALFESLSEHGIPGRPWMVDHVHASIEGYQRIAGVLLEELVHMGKVTLPNDFAARQRASYEHQLASLDPHYMERASVRLENLRAWAGGRAIRQRPAPAPLESRPSGGRDSSE